MTASAPQAKANSLRRNSMPGSVASVQREGAEGASKSPYRQEIDGLRALAVIAVIINHFDGGLLPSGYLGVDIFFVISGYVITSSLAGRSSNSLGEFLVTFYARRVKRLVPALVLFVVVTAFLTCLFNANPGVSLKTGVASLFGGSNIFLRAEALDYFADAMELNAFTHTWSLGVEEQFYLLFPLLVWGTGVGRKGAKGDRNLLLVLAPLSAISLVAFILLHEGNHADAYFLMPTRLWELAAGCWLFVGLRNSSVLARVLAKLPPLVVLVSLLAVLFLPVDTGALATPAAVALTTTLIACIRPGTGAYLLFTLRPLVSIGLVSYSLYLWHWGVLYLSRFTIGIHWWSAPFLVALMLMLSFASFRYVERPLRRATWSGSSGSSIGYGLAASVSAAILLLVLLIPLEGSLYQGRAPSMIAIGVESLTNSYSPEGSESTWQGDPCILDDNPDIGRIVEVGTCSLGDFATAKKRIVVAGDSSSAAFVQAFDDLVVRDGFAVVITSSWSAAPVGGVPAAGPYRGTNEYYWQQVVPGLVEQLRPGDWLFLISDLLEFSLESPDEARLKLYRDGLVNLSSELSGAGIRLAVLHGTSLARESKCKPSMAIKQWFAPFGEPNCKIPNRAHSLSRRRALDAMLVSLEEEGQLTIVDLFDVFCPGAECTYFGTTGEILYRDELAHPSVEAARLSAPLIRRVFTDN